MANTTDLAAIHAHCQAAEAKLLLVGDHRQLAAVGAAGGMDTGRRATRAARHELTETRRFTPRLGRRRRRCGSATATRPCSASTTSTAGSSTAARSSRPRPAPPAAWLADTLTGQHALLIVDTNEQAARLSAQLRADLVRLGRVDDDAPCRSACRAPAPASATWSRPAQRLAPGRLRRQPARPDQPRAVPRPRRPRRRRPAVATAHGQRPVEGERIVLPADYVAEHVALGYASTVHAAQGLTVDTSHTVATAATGAEALYVGMTRGRTRNTAHVVTQAVPADAPPGVTVAAACTAPRRPCLAGAFETSRPAAVRAGRGRRQRGRGRVGADPGRAVRRRRPTRHRRPHRPLARPTRHRRPPDTRPARRARRRRRRRHPDHAAAPRRARRPRPPPGPDRRDRPALTRRRPPDHQRAPPAASPRPPTSTRSATPTPTGSPTSTTRSGAPTSARSPSRPTSAAPQLGEQVGCRTAAMGRRGARTGSRRTRLAARLAGRRVAVVAAHRELVGHDDPEDALGPVAASRAGRGLRVVARRLARARPARGRPRRGRDVHRAAPGPGPRLRARDRPGHRPTSPTNSPAPARPPTGTAKTPRCAAPKRRRQRLDRGPPAASDAATASRTGRSPRRRARRPRRRPRCRRRGPRAVVRPHRRDPRRRRPRPGRTVRPRSRR